MRHPIIRVIVALLTFVTGLGLAWFWVSDNSSDRRLTTISEFRLISNTQFTFNPPDDYSSPLDSIFIKGSRLTYKGYEVSRSFDPVEEVSSAAIKKNGKTLAAFNDGGLSEDTTRIGLFSFLGGETKQLIIEQYSGGAHCCWQYWIYDLSPNLRLLFSSEKYEVGYELGFVDINKDGKFELTQSVMTFDYFYMSHASSTFPVAVFAYNKKAKEYRPANKIYPGYVLKGIEDEINQAVETNAGLVPDSPVKEIYLSPVLRVMLKYIYAGKEKEGWSFYDRLYNLSDKVEMKSLIRKALESEPIFRSIYKHPR